MGKGSDDRARKAAEAEAREALEAAEAAEQAEAAAAELRAEDEDTARLVARFQAGDREAYGEIYSRYVDRVYGYLKLALRNRDDAEDVAQQSFADALEALPRYELRGKPFRAWLFVIVRNGARMQLRRRSRVEAMDPAEIARRVEASQPPEGEPEVLGRITDRELLLFLERLPIGQRQALVMRHVLDLSAADVAAAMDNTEEAVRALSYRATQTLKQRLTAVGRGPEETPESREQERSSKSSMKAGIRQAPVLRNRRFALLD